MIGSQPPPLLLLTTIETHLTDLLLISPFLRTHAGNSRGGNIALDATGKGATNAVGAREVTQAADAQLSTFPQNQSKVGSQGGPQLPAHQPLAIEPPQAEPQPRLQPASQLVPTPIHALRFNQLLQGYEPNWRKYLVRGLTQGFPLEINFGAQFQSKDTPPLRYNHQSLYRHIQPIREKINKELDAGRVEGPYDVIPYDNYHISPLAAQEKKTPGEYRILHDLSWPKGASVNDEIPKNAGKCTYQSMDAIIDSLVELGPNTNLTVIDIEHAYKVLPVQEAAWRSG